MGGAYSEALQENAGGLPEERGHAEPPGAWLLWAAHPESAECPGSGQPSAHGEGQLSGRKLVLILKAV